LSTFLRAGLSYYNRGMIGYEKLFYLIKKRNKPIEEVAHVVAQALPYLSEEDLRSFAICLEQELQDNKKFREYWLEVLDIAYKDEAFRNKFEGSTSDPKVIAHKQADIFVKRIHTFVQELMKAFKPT
jgi:hypothetical protein